MRVNASRELNSIAAIVGSRKARQRCLNRGETIGTREGSAGMAGDGWRRFEKMPHKGFAEAQ